MGTLSKIPTGKVGGRVALLLQVELGLGEGARLSSQRQRRLTADHSYPSLEEHPAPAPAGPTGGFPLLDVMFKLLSCFSRHRRSRGLT